MVSDDGCVTWVSVWLPKKLPSGFNERRFLCAYCASQEVEDLEGKLEKVQNPDPSAQQDQGRESSFNADTIEQYGRRNNIRIFGADEAPGEDPI